MLTRWRPAPPPLLPTPPLRPTALSCCRNKKKMHSCVRFFQRLEDSAFHYEMCNDCVHILTVEGASPPLRIFKTLSVPGTGARRGGDASGGITDPTSGKGIPVDLGNGVVVTAMTKEDVGVKVEWEAAGGSAGITRALPPPPPVDLWSARRAAAKAKAAALAASSSASAGVAAAAPFTHACNW